MRFEFNAADVIALVGLVLNNLEVIKDYNITAFNAIQRMYRKLKMYSQDAYPNRDSYRKEMKLLSDKIEEKWSKYAKNNN
jgi:hypothetical protein